MDSCYSIECHRIDYRLCTTWVAVEKLSWSPLFVDIFSQSVVGVCMFKGKVVLDKSMYILCSTFVLQNS